MEVGKSMKEGKAYAASPEDLVKRSKNRVAHSGLHFQNDWSGIVEQDTQNAAQAGAGGDVGFLGITIGV